MPADLHTIGTPGLRLVHARAPCMFSVRADTYCMDICCLQVDPATQAPARDGPRLAKWEKALRAMCARMGAKFVSYKPDGGVWKFEVRLE